MSGTDAAAQRRCDWCLAAPDYTRYHDEEWGVPLADDRRLFECLVLESAQAGLSWLTILRKRDAYRRAFADFDAQRVAAFGERDVERLVRDAAIVRHRAKIVSTIGNARAFLDVQSARGSFAGFLWGFVDGTPVINRWRRVEDVPATTRVSDRLARELKALGFRFLGSTTVYAYMQATGMVNDHLVGCFRHAACARLTPALGKAVESSRAAGRD